MSISFECAYCQNISPHFRALIDHVEEKHPEKLKHFVIRNRKLRQVLSSKAESAEQLCKVNEWDLKDCKVEEQERMIGEIIKNRRVAKALAMRAVSSQSGVSLAHLARIERGERNPSGQVLRKLASPLGFTEIQLFKLAGFLSPDEVDDRMENLKGELKRETTRCLALLLHKIDAFNAQ